MENFIRVLPKVELHVHIEGTLEPEMVLSLAKRNGIALPYDSLEALQSAYDIHDKAALQALEDQIEQVLVSEQDFYDLTLAYLHKCAEQKVLHTEIFFDPQRHMSRGVAFTTVITGIHRALNEGREKLDISSHLIMCFLRQRSEQEAFALLETAMPHRAMFVGVGLDGEEKDNPPEKFARVFDHARSLGFRLVAHAGESGPADYVRTALDVLEVERIGHGVHSIEDSALLQRLKQARIPLTMCPLANVRGQLFRQLADHNISRLLRDGLCITINSDRPALYGGYIEENLSAIAQVFKLTRDETAQLSLNAVEASFMPLQRKATISRNIIYLLHACSIRPD